MWLVAAPWVLLAMFVGVLAARRGRSAVGYFWLSCLLTPLLGLLIVLLAGPRAPSGSAGSAGPTRFPCP